MTRGGGTQRVPMHRRTLILNYVYRVLGPKRRSPRQVRGKAGRLPASSGDDHGSEATHPPCHRAERRAGTAKTSRCERQDTNAGTSRSLTEPSLRVMDVA